MHKETVLDQFEVSRDGTISLRFAKQVVDDDGSIIATEYHRTVVPPGVDLDGRLGAVNAHLQIMGAAVVSSSDSLVTTLRTVTPQIQTDKVIEDYVAARADISEAR